MAKTYPNRAEVAVTFPDGCRAKWTTKPTGPLASNPVAMANWLREVADTIEEGATTDGQHVGKGK